MHPVGNICDLIYVIAAHTRLESPVSHKVHNIWFFNKNSLFKNFNLLKTNTNIKLMENLHILKLHILITYSKKMIIKLCSE